MVEAHLLCSTVDLLLETLVDICTREITLMLREREEERCKEKEIEDTPDINR